MSKPRRTNRRLNFKCRVWTHKTKVFEGIWVYYSTTVRYGSKGLCRIRVVSVKIPKKEQDDWLTKGKIPLSLVRRHFLHGWLQHKSSLFKTLMTSVASNITFPLLRQFWHYSARLREPKMRVQVVFFFPWTGEHSLQLRQDRICMNELRNPGMRVYWSVKNAWCIFALRQWRDGRANVTMTGGQKWLTVWNWLCKHTKGIKEILLGKGKCIISKS